MTDLSQYSEAEDARALGRLNAAIQSLSYSAASTEATGRTEAPAADLRVPPPGMDPVVLGNGEYQTDAAGKSIHDFPCPTEMPARKRCKLCGEPTTGSVGAAGIRWSFICQPCKNREDRAALRALGGLFLSASQAKTLIAATNDLLAVIHEDMTHAQQEFRREPIEAAQDAVTIARNAMLDK